LFPEREADAELPAPTEVRWAWLAPVMGCFMAMMVISSARTTQFATVEPTNWLAAVASNQSYAAYAFAGFHSEQNALQQDPIEWTNGARVQSDPVPHGRLATNSLIR
jgi:hypothetical protein